MGANMARRLKDEGYILTAVYDSEPSKRTSLGNELRCEAAATPARVAECSDTILTVISDDAGMRHIFSPQRSDSLLTHAQGRLFINCATLSPQVHRDIETLLEQHGGHSLEACMAGSITQARNGTLYLMCGGKVEAFERAQLLLASLGSSIRHIGGAGEAAKVKALVNMVMNINTAGLAEGLGLGAALGLDLSMLRDVFGQTGAPRGYSRRMEKICSIVPMTAISLQPMPPKTRALRSRWDAQPACRYLWPKPHWSSINDWSRWARVNWINRPSPN